MTIKRRLFISNIRMIVISVVTFGLAGRVATTLFFDEGWRPDPEVVAMFRESSSFTHDTMMSVFFLALVFFIIIMSILNSYLTHRMTRRIVKPLEPLSEGVKQIQANNLSYRIDYQDNDEFLPICDAFNEMALKLETSTSQRQKDEKNRRELIAGISHDLRTPLTSIKGSIEGIETGVAATPEMRDKYLGIIKDKAAVMEHIIEQLFLFSKLDMDEFPLNLRPVDITFVVTEMMEDILSEYTSRGLEIKFTEKQENIFVSADVFMLRNVINNILENSLKYKTKENVQMEISSQLVNGFFLLNLADDGPGVPEEALPNLFDVFYRSDPSRSTMGSGLGLAISAKIIERMGGTIHAELLVSGGLAIVISLPVVHGETV